MLLEGRIALVTGAGQGNGAAIARGLAAEGAKVVVTDIRADTADATAAGINRAGHLAWSFPLDVRDVRACHDLAGRLQSIAAPVSILVNNAGINLPHDLDAEELDAAWRATLDVNLDGTLNVTRALLPALRQTRGSVINLASIASFTAAAASLGYNASKGAIRSLTQSLAKELAPHGVRVNAIAPGVIDTAMTARIRDDPTRRAQFMARIPMRRFGKPEDLVGPVVFLASPLADYVTGAILPVDGGYLAA